MPSFVTPASSGPVLRARLRLESLDARVVPSGWTPEPSPALDADLAAPAGPQIVEFTAEEFDHGWYHFTGRVQATPSCAGLRVTFGGVPSLQGLSAVTNSDGTFSLTIRVRTDGSDNGTVTAQTTVGGQQSNLALCDITPTP
jgi:hypothetical protein